MATGGDLIRKLKSRMPELPSPVAGALGATSSSPAVSQAPTSTVPVVAPPPPAEKPGKRKRPTTTDKPLEGPSEVPQEGASERQVVVTPAATVVPSSSSTGLNLNEWKQKERIQSTKTDAGTRDELAQLVEHLESVLHITSSLGASHIGSLKSLATARADSNSSKTRLKEIEQSKDVLEKEKAALEEKNAALEAEINTLKEKAAKDAESFKKLEADMQALALTSENQAAFVFGAGNHLGGATVFKAMKKAGIYTEEWKNYARAFFKLYPADPEVPRDEDTLEEEYPEEQPPSTTEVTAAADPPEPSTAGGDQEATEEEGAQE